MSCLFFKIKIYQGIIILFYTINQIDLMIWNALMIVFLLFNIIFVPFEFSFKAYMIPPSKLY